MSQNTETNPTLLIHTSIIKTFENLQNREIRGKKKRETTGERSQWDSNPRLLDSESNAISTSLCDRILLNKTHIKTRSTPHCFPYVGTEETDNPRNSPTKTNQMRGNKNHARKIEKHTQKNDLWFFTAQNRSKSIPIENSHRLPFLFCPDPLKKMYDRRKKIRSSIVQKGYVWEREIQLEREREVVRAIETELGFRFFPDLKKVDGGDRDPNFF